MTDKQGKPIWPFETLRTPGVSYGRQHKRSEAERFMTMKPTIRFNHKFFHKHFTPSKSEPERYVAEASDLGFKTTLELDITIDHWPAIRTNTTFLYTGRDMNGDDIAGFKYQEKDGRRQILIIND